VARLPASILTFAAGSTFFIELVLPFFIFSPRRLRFVAAFGFLLLQSIILLTGNYNWFNLQTMLLCLLLFDDGALIKVAPGWLTRLNYRRAENYQSGQTRKIIIAGLTILIVLSSLLQMDRRFGGSLPEAAQEFESVIEPWRIVHGYGLFAIMTTKREEIIIEGSDDNLHWREYEFRYKPGNRMRAPLWNIPYQPRLDWEMWFAALDDPLRLQWFWNFIQRLLENEPAVTDLLQNNPFPNKPPIFVRALLYDYTFSNNAEKAKGIWWDRRLVGIYFQPTVRAQ